ncbi:MAG: hypothetical protein A3H91_17220, partial [Gammaproteobacteria bacterium RIFCSPLOWO2_02_FULL_61_13]
DLPHHYYYREMFLPQVSGGTDSVDWSADGKSVIFAQHGYLWRQTLDSAVAEQLTDSEGYDFQPDWSPDGMGVVFARDSRDAIELHLLNLTTGEVTAITDGGAVNVEPRWSPDGSQLAWVSTRDNGRFQVYVGALENGKLQAQRLRTERRSRAPRYYYSEYDHELSPTWSPDGTELIFVTNPETSYGTGGLWRAALSGGGAMKPVRIEETTWKARPDWSPDGRRVIYSSFLGQQWHQLWITTAAGGEPFPLTYGDFDITGARWAPDGNRIAYVSNESGNNQLWILDLSRGGVRKPLLWKEQKFLRPHGRLELHILDGRGKPVAARIALRDTAGRYFSPSSAWAHAADGFDRGNTDATFRYFHSDGESELEVPAGTYSVTVWRGLEHFIARQSVDVAAGGTTQARIESQSMDLPKSWSGWSSGDLHVHMNYGGMFRNTPATLVSQAAAEDLDLVYNLVVNKEQRIPDIGYFSTQPDPASNDGVLVLHGQEFHTSLWGHLGLLGLNDHFIMPDYVAYPNTAAASPYPGNSVVADYAHEQGGLVGYVHPFDTLPDPGTEESLANSLPVDVALGKVDYYEVVGFSDHKASAEVWHRLLNCGFRISAGAGTDAMANFASLRGPVGLNRVYAKSPGRTKDLALRQQQWLAALKSGHTFATNGPLLQFTVAGKGPGETLEIGGGDAALSYAGSFRSIVPIQHLQILVNGAVARELETGPDGMDSEFSGTINVADGGWVLLRAYSEDNVPEIFDLYPYATTTPVWLEADGKSTGGSCDSGYFLAWLDRIQAVVEKHPDYNTDAERERLLNDVEFAREVYQKASQ